MGEMLRRVLERLQAKSVKCGYLRGTKKEAVLKQIFGITTRAAILK